MSSKKTNGRNNKKSIAPTVLSALTIAPAIITAVEELIDKLPDIPSKVGVPQLYDPDFKVERDDAVTALTGAGLSVVSSKLDLKEANPKYRDYFDFQVVGPILKRGQKVQAGSIVFIKYITQEVIDESQRLFEELEKQEAEKKRIKNEKRDQQKEQRQRAVADATDKVKRLPGKILHHKEKGHEFKDL